MHQLTLVHVVWVSLGSTARFSSLHESSALAQRSGIVETNEEKLTQYNKVLDLTWNLQVIGIRRTYWAAQSVEEDAGTLSRALSGLSRAESDVRDTRRTPRVALPP